MAVYNSNYELILRPTRPDEGWLMSIFLQGNGMYDCIAAKFVDQNERIEKYHSMFCGAPGDEPRITKKRMVALEGFEQTQEPEPPKKPPPEIPRETPPERPPEPPAETPGEPAPEMPEEPPAEVPAETPPPEAPLEPLPEMKIGAEPSSVAVGLADGSLLVQYPV